MEFPDEIQEAIFNQHDLLNEEVSPYALLIGLASFMISGFSHAMSEEDMLATLPANVMERAGLKREDLAAALPELREACTALDEMF